MCHPTKNEDGDIEDVEAMTAFIHFASIFWKLVYFMTCPPPHYLGGWACFICSLTMIGVATWVVADFANLVGCSFGFDPKFTAITFVALGTSLPDTFASMTAAVQDKYADPALGNVTGSNAVNVFLGLGLPWMIATIWEGGVYLNTEENNGYYIEAGSLGFSVVVFTCLAVTCIITIIIRRNVVGGELGGSKNGRLGSCIFLCTLWLIYIVMSTLKMNDVIDPGRMAIDPHKVHRLEKCWSKGQIKFLKENMVEGTQTTLYEKKQGIAACIQTILKARKTNPDTPWPTDNSCGVPI
jgi:solute carrier family 8 (sodium/calcium exchanger)